MVRRTSSVLQGERRAQEAKEAGAKKSVTNSGQMCSLYSVSQLLIDLTQWLIDSTLVDELLLDNMSENHKMGVQREQN